MSEQARAQNVDVDVAQRLTGRLRDHYSNKPLAYPLSTILHEILTGKTTLPNIHARIGGNSLRYITEYARKVRSDPKSADAYKRIKESLPAVCFGGMLDDERQILTPSGLGILDFDDVDDLPGLIAEITQSPETLAAFRSPSGEGLKVLVHYDPYPSAEDSMYAWHAAFEHYSHLAEADPTGKEQSKLCALVHDPYIYINYNAAPLRWERDEITYLDTFPADDVEVADTGEWANIPIRHKEELKQLEFNDKGWSKTALPCIFADHTHDGWHARSNGMYIYKNLDGWTFKCFKCPTSKRYFLRSQSKPVKLKNIERFAGVIETLDVARAELKDVFDGKSQDFAIRTDTGTGKTENALTYAATHDVFMPVQGGNLRDEIVLRATDEHELFALGYRGLNSPSDADGGDYLGCIQPDRADAFRKNGYNMYTKICPACPSHLDCQERGYLSQKEKASKSQLVVMPFPTVFLDPGLRKFADTYMPRGENALVIHDDLPVGSMFVECSISTDRLRRIRNEWSETHASVWADDVLAAIGTQNWMRLSQFVGDLDDRQRGWVVLSLTHAAYREGNPITADAYLDAGADFSTADACRQLPELETEDWNALIKLELFFEHYKRCEDMPILVSNIPNSDNQMLTWYIPPLPYRAKKSLRIGYMSATYNKTVIERVLPGVEFIDASVTEWSEGAGVYQLRTNKNPRGTVLNIGTDSNDDSPVLSATGESYYKCVLDSVKAHPNEKHALITYKTVLNEKQGELESLGVITAHFGNLVGLDKLFEGVSRYHVLFSPEVAPDDISFLAKMIYGNDDTPLNYDRDDNGEYVDSRMQHCVDSLVISELKQIVGRARLNLYPNIVYLWTSRFVDGITNRAETRLFDESDWKRSASGDTDLLDTAITHREQKENDAEQLTRENTPAEFQKANGTSQKHAYRLWHAAGGKAHKEAVEAELRQRAIELKDQGLSLRKIADELQISRRKVSRILNDCSKVVQN